MKWQMLFVLLSLLLFVDGFTGTRPRLLPSTTHLLLAPLRSAASAADTPAPAPAPAVWNKATIYYCTKCRWNLRANWLSQELLSTFPQSELQEVSLVPIAEPAGVFVIKINEKVVWDRKSESTPGFPEGKDLKQAVRDVLVPDKSLGHSDSAERKAARVVEVEEGPDRALIDGVIQDYLDGLYEGDAEKIGRAFHETCCLTHFNATAGEMRVVTRDNWLQLVRARPSPQSLGLTRHDEVLSVDVISPTTAFVKLRCAIPPRFFVDSLNLLKVKGQWQIVQKIFSVEEKDISR